MRLPSLLGSRARANSSSQSLSAIDEAQQLEEAMRAVSHIMNDDVDTAESLLGDGASPFHKLGKGVVAFLRAMLKVDPEALKEASDVLSDAEASAAEHNRKAQRHASRSSIYPAGSEYALCLAQAQLINAVVAVLSKSVTESVRGFYKLRKAFIALDAIMEAEKAGMQTREAKISAARSAEIASVLSEAMSATGSDPGLSAGITNERNARHRFTVYFDADEYHYGWEPPEAYEGHLEINGHLHPPIPPPKNDVIIKPYMDVSGESQELNGLGDMELNGAVQPNGARKLSEEQAATDSDFLGNDPVDVFIRSGANLCFGLLQLLISIIPPALATLLKVIGFKGDRQRGMSMLWQATKHNNLYGGLAGIVILTYFNGMIRYCDIIPKEGEGSYPKDQCQALLADMRKRYPTSHLWLLEDACMHASDRELESAIGIMKGSTKSRLKQVEALHWLERSLNLMFAHQYEECSEAFQKCVTLNNWTHAQYFYIAGCAHVELYRQYKRSNPRLAQSHAEKALKLYKIVPNHAGKKRFMGRQLPLDVFVTRKLQKWERRASEWQVPFIDAIGVSPINEIIYFWNGFRRMRPKQLSHSLAALSWSTNTAPHANPHWAKETFDEHAILGLLQATVLRNLGRPDDAKDALIDNVLNHDWAEFKRAGTTFGDSWICPAAHYEMAACLWLELEGEGEIEGAGADAWSLKECGSWLEKASKWESYEMDTRIGVRIITGKDTLRRRGVDTVS